MGILLGRLYDFLTGLVRGRRGEKLFVALFAGSIGAIVLLIWYLKLRFY